MKSSVQVSELCLLSFQRVCTSVRGAKRVAKAGHTLYLWALLPLGARSTCHLGFEWCGDVVTLTYFPVASPSILMLVISSVQTKHNPHPMARNDLECVFLPLTRDGPLWPYLGALLTPQNGPTTSAFSTLSLQSNIVHVYVEPSYLYKICLCFAHSLMFVRHCWCFWPYKFMSTCSDASNNGG
jgi:hypothetical protein